MTTERPSRLARLGGAISQFFNVLVFNGDENYSISTDAHRFKRETLARRIDRLAARFGEQDHCRMSYQHDINQAVKLLTEAGYTVTKEQA